MSGDNDNKNGMTQEVSEKKEESGETEDKSSLEDIASKYADESSQLEDLETETQETEDAEQVEGEVGEPAETEDAEPKEAEVFEHVPKEVLLSRIESLVFSFPEPITVRRLAKQLSLKGPRVRELLKELQEHYADRGIVLSEASGGFHFHTNPNNSAVIKNALKVRPMRLSRPALETLAIIAYKQPTTRADVEDVRRVDCGGTIRFLFEKNLIRVLGRKEEPGRPMIYGTSKTFLELFGLKTLSDLPSLHEFTELWEEHQQAVDEIDETESQEDEGDDAALDQMDDHLDDSESITENWDERDIEDEND